MVQMLMAQDNTRQILETNVRPHELALRAFTTVDEPLQVLIGYQSG
jgi:hypothetical protein